MNEIEGSGTTIKSMDYVEFECSECKAQGLPRLRISVGEAIYHADHHSKGTPPPAHHVHDFPPKRRICRVCFVHEDELS